MSLKIFCCKRLLEVKWYCISRSDRFILQFPALWIDTFNMSRESKYINYIIFDCFFLLYYLFFCSYILQCVFSYHFDKTISVDTDGLQIFEDWNCRGPTFHIEIAIDNTRGNRIILPHAMWMAFIENRVDIQRLVQLSTPSKVMILTLSLNLLKYVMLIIWNYL